MSAANWLQLVALVGALVVTAPLLGVYLARVLGGGAAPGDRFFLPVERALYRMAGVDPGREQPWNVYALSLLAFSAVSVVGLYLLERVAGGVAAESDGGRWCFVGAGVQHGGELRDEHELAELRGRVDDEPSDADGRADRAELRVRRGRYRGRGRARARADPAPVGDDRQLLGRPHARDGPRAVAARGRDRASAGVPGRGAELPAPPRRGRSKARRR